MFHHVLSCSLRQKLPEVRVVLMYVHAREETVYRRAVERGLEGRVVSQVEAGRAGVF